jgi:hypothetical protein
MRHFLYGVLFGLAFVIGCELGADDQAAADARAMQVIDSLRLAPLRAMAPARQVWGL